MTSLTVAYVDVVGLKAVNDTLGHRAGDRLLHEVVALLGRALRPYDRTIRLGGDEFLCVMPGMDAAPARARFEAITDDTVPAPDPRRLRIGVASLEPGETCDELIARADHAMINQRHVTAKPELDDGRAESRQRIDLTDLLTALDQFGVASLDLLAREFSVPESALREHWDLFIQQELITSDGNEPVVGKTMYSLTGHGAFRLRVGDRTSAGDESLTRRQR